MATGTEDGFRTLTRQGQLDRKGATPMTPAATQARHISLLRLEQAAGQAFGYADEPEPVAPRSAIDHRAEAGGSFRARGVSEEGTWAGGWVADCAGRLAPTWSEGPEPRPMLTGPVPRLAEVSWLGEGAQVTDRDPCPGRPRRARASRRADEAPGVSHHRPAGGWDGPGGAAVAPVAGGAWLPRGGRRSCTPSHGPGFLDIDAFRQLAGCVMRAACPRRLAPRGEGMPRPRIRGPRSRDTGP